MQGHHCLRNEAEQKQETALGPSPSFFPSQHPQNHFPRDPTFTLVKKQKPSLPKPSSSAFIFSLTDALSNEGTSSTTSDCHILSSLHDSSTLKFRTGVLCQSTLPGIAVLLGPDDGSWNIGGIGHIALTARPGLLGNVTAIIVQVCQKEAKQK